MVVGPIRLTLSLFGLCALAACGTPRPPARFDGKTFRRGEEHFQVTAPPPWDQAWLPDGDVAYRDPETKAVMAANATCRGHHDPPLSVLVNDLLIGTTARSVLFEETVNLEGREAMHKVMALRLDGVPLVYDLYVFKKDGCVYDLTLVCRPRAYDRVADQFVAFVAGFRAEGFGPGG